MIKVYLLFSKGGEQVTGEHYCEELEGAFSTKAKARKEGMEIFKEKEYDEAGYDFDDEFIIKEFDVV